MKKLNLILAVLFMATATVLFNLGQLYLRLNDHDEAIKAYQSALTINLKLNNQKTISKYPIIGGSNWCFVYAYFSYNFSSYNGFRLFLFPLPTTSNTEISEARYDTANL